jgi:hypothetical protein
MNGYAPDTNPPDVFNPQHEADRLNDRGKGVGESSAREGYCEKKGGSIQTAIHLIVGNASHQASLRLNGLWQ